MGEEIESLYALLGVKPDEASVSDSVNKLVKDIQSKLKSSIYGGENGVITLPATLEGKFKNGKETLTPPSTKKRNRWQTKASL